MTEYTQIKRKNVIAIQITSDIHLNGIKELFEFIYGNEWTEKDEDIKSKNITDFIRRTSRGGSYYFSQPTTCYWESNDLEVKINDWVCKSIVDGEVNNVPFVIYDDVFDETYIEVNKN